MLTPSLKQDLISESTASLRRLLKFYGCMSRVDVKWFEFTRYIAFLISERDRRKKNDFSLHEDGCFPLMGEEVGGHVSDSYP